MKNISWIIALIILVFSLQMTSLKNNSQEDYPTYSSIDINVPEHKHNTIIVYTEANYPPFEFIDKNNKLVGFDIDLMNLIAKELNWEIEFISIHFKDIFNEIYNSPDKLAIADIFITHERAENFIFSEPYINGHDSLILHVKVLNQLTDFNKLKRLPICVEKGSSQEETLLKLGFSKVIVCLSNNICNSFYNSRKCEGIFRSEFVNRYYIRNGLINDAFTSDFTSFNNDNKSAIMLNKNNVKMQGEINSIINKFKEDGTLFNLRKKWLYELSSEFKDIIPDENPNQ